MASQRSRSKWFVSEILPYTGSGSSMSAV
jgi:hypothetical protein